jgi:hypothetical protein
MNIAHRSNRAMIAAVIELLAKQFPKAFAIYERRRRPPKIGIDSDFACRARWCRYAERADRRAPLLQPQHRLSL